MRQEQLSPLSQCSQKHLCFQQYVLFLKGFLHYLCRLIFPAVINKNQTLVALLSYVKHYRFLKDKIILIDIVKQARTFTKPVQRTKEFSKSIIELAIRHYSLRAGKRGSKAN